MTLARNPICIGKVIDKPHGLSGFADVDWIWSYGHQWRSPQRYLVGLLKRLNGDFETLKSEILEKESK